jgi:hypothetical protein
MTARLALLRRAAVWITLLPAATWAGENALAARIKGLLLVAGWIDGLLLATVLLAALVLLRKFNPNAELEVPLTKISVPIGSLALCFVALTIAHGYLAWLFHQHTHSFVNEVNRVRPAAVVSPGADGCPAISEGARSVFGEAFTTLTTQGGPLWNGLKASRVEYFPPAGCIESNIGLSFGDPPVWLYVAGLTVMLLSIVKAYRLGRTMRSRLLYLGVAAALVAINWQIGSFWVGSALALDSVNPSRFFLSWPMSRVFMP